MFNWLRNLFSTEEYRAPKEAPTPAPAKKAEAKKPAAKPAAKKATVKKADLAKLTKDKLEAFAKKEFKVDIDKRKKKADLVDEVFKLSKK
jgi:hypothetical protein